MSQNPTASQITYSTWYGESATREYTVYGDRITDRLQRDRAEWEASEYVLAHLLDACRCQVDRFYRRGLYSEYETTGEWVGCPQTPDEWRQVGRLRRAIRDIRAERRAVYARTAMDLGQIRDAAPGLGL